MSDYIQNNPSLQTFPGQAPFLSEPGTSHLWNNLLGNENMDSQYPDFFRAPINGNIMGTNGTTELDRRAASMARGPFDLQYRIGHVHTHSGSSTHSDPGTFIPVPPTLTPILSGPRQHRQDFTCIQCGTTYDRRSRARDCQYQDRGETPYQCRGSCGDIWWSVHPYYMNGCN